jgi:F0F1-type ATP synthase assembly protein I
MYSSSKDYGPIFVNEDKQNLSGNGPWWKPGMVILSEVSTWIVAPIILALIGGKALDNHYHTKPYFFLICIGISFLVSAYGIFKAVRNYMKTLKEVDKK